MAIETIDNFNIFVGRNIDNRYGPYANESEANLAINSIFRFEGLTVLLTGSGNQIEYWYNPTIADNDLVPKGAAVSLSGTDTQVVFFSGSTQISGSPSMSYNYTTNHFFVTGSTTLSGSTFIPGISNLLQTNVVTINPATGQLFYTASNSLTGVSIPLDIKDDGTPVYSNPAVLNFTGSGVSASANGTTVDIYIPGDGVGTPGGDNTQIQFNGGGVFSGSSNFTFISSSNIVNLTGSIFVSGAISASYGSNTVGFYGTASWAQSASNALFAQTASFITASNVWGIFGSSSVDSASFASSSISASYAETASLAYTASFITASNVWGPFGSSSVASASFASSSISASYAETASLAYTASFITASNVWGPFGSSSVASASFASSSVSASYAETASAAPSDTYIQYNNNGLLGAEQYFRYIYNSHSLEQGNNVTASGQYSHAQGYESEVYGIYSHAEGYNTYVGTNRAYSASFTNNTGSLLSSYGNKASAFSVGEYILWYNGSFKGYTLIESKSYDGSITQVFVDFLSNGQYDILPIRPGVGAHSATGDQIIPVSGAHAEGYQSEALGDYSSAVGSGIAVGIGSQAIGGGLALGDNSQAVGDAYAIGIYSRAEGNNSKAIGNYSHAEGVRTKAQGVGSHTEGFRTLTEGEYSHTEGHFTTASGDYSHAEGSGSIALGNYQLVIGQFNIANTSQSAFIVGDGINNSNRHNLLFASASWFEVSASNVYLQGLPTSSELNVLVYNSSSGRVYYTASSTLGSGGEGTPAPSDTFIQYNSGSTFAATGSFRFIYTSQSLQQGNIVTASGLYSHAEGDNTKALGNYSHAEGSNSYTGIVNGYSASVSSGVVTLWENYDDVTGEFNIGDYLAFTDASPFFTATCQFSPITNITFTNPNTVITLANNLVNYSKVIVGNISVLPYNWLGDQNIGFEYAHAEGTATVALGIFSHAEGYGTVAGAASSHAEGNQTVAVADYQSVTGKFNALSLSQSAFIIGDGEDQNNRHNVLFVSRSHFEVSASTVYLQGLPTSSELNVLVYNSSSGQVYYTASNAIGGGGGGNPAPPTNSIQFNNDGVFGGSEIFTFVPASSSVYLTGSLLIGSSSVLSLYTTAKTTTIAGLNTIYSLQTASYDGAFFDYTLISGLNARAGQIMSIWSGSEIRYTDTTTTDIGSTSEFIFSVALTAGSASLQVTGSTGAVIKTIIKSI